MRLPRRVPWRSLEDLDDVCNWIFSPEADETTKRAAVNRLAAWRATTKLPHALESTWMILSVVLDDSAMSMHVSGASSSIVLRQSYALAIIRLVNGLVDPLQQGVYARPISSIAAQIGLPSWLVEVRHAATHEDLPSLDLLREAATQSLNWLLNNYWLPTISPHHASENPLPELPSLAPLLKEYKELLKLTTRDISLKTRHKADIVRLLRNLERWIGEAKVAYGLGRGQMDDEEKERFAIDQFCEELLQKGFLVPISKKKRVDSTTTFLTSPPNSPLWEQLLTHVQTNHTSFGAQLTYHIIIRIIGSDGSDPSADECLSGWILWAVESWGEDYPDCSAESVAFSALSELPQAETENLSVHARIQRILEALPISDVSVQKRFLALLHATSELPALSEEVTLETMEQRIAHLNSSLRASALDEGEMAMDQTDVPVDAEKNPAPGIRLLGPETGWQPCPIGYNGLTMRL